MTEIYRVPTVGTDGKVGSEGGTPLADVVVFARSLPAAGGLVATSIDGTTNEVTWGAGGGYPVPTTIETISPSGMDDTPTLIEAIADIAATPGAGRLCLNDGEYNIGGALQTLGGTHNSQIPIPMIGAGAQGTLELCGSHLSWADSSGTPPTDGAILISTLTAASGTNPSVIGGPIAPVSGAGTNLNVRLDKIGIRCQPNPPLAGANLQFVQMCDLPLLRVDTTDNAFTITEPTNDAAFGVLMPGVYGNVMTRGGLIWVSGFFCGLLTGEGTEIDVLQSYGNKVSLSVNQSSHVNRINSLWSLHCPYGIAYVSPTGSAPSAFPEPGSANVGFLLTVNNWDIEDENPDHQRFAWADPVYHVWDDNAYLYGQARSVVHCSGGVGNIQTPLTLRNAPNFKLFYDGGVPAADAYIAQAIPVGAGGSAPAFQGAWGDFGSGVEPVGFYIDRDGIVHLYGSAKGTGTGPGYSAETIFTLPAAGALGAGSPSYRPAGGTLVYSGQQLGSNNLVQVTIGTNGDVQASATLGSDTDGVSFDGITFLAGN